MAIMYVENRRNSNNTKGRIPFQVCHKLKDGGSKIACFFMYSPSVARDKFYPI